MTPSRPMVPIAVLAAAFLFSLGQGVLRLSMPLYLDSWYQRPLGVHAASLIVSPYASAANAPYSKVSR
jgi:hypothetical protein